MEDEEGFELWEGEGCVITEYLEEQLIKHRTILLVGEISELEMERVGSCLTVMFGEDPEKPVKLMIGSEGGDVWAGFGICDLITGKPVWTYAVGEVMSMALPVFVCGQRRYAYPNARFMAHSVSTGAQGKVDDVQSSAEESRKLQEMLTELLLKRTRLTREFLEGAIRRAAFFGAREALEWGVCDEIIGGGNK